MPTATKTREITFVTPCPNLYLAIKPARHERRDAMDRVIQEADSGHHIQFDQGRYLTSDPDEIEFLRGHRLFNMIGINGVWEEGAAPDEPKPTSAEQMSEIVRLARAEDVKGLGELIASEEETHRRPAILVAARETVDAIESEARPEGGTSKEK